MPNTAITGRAGSGSSSRVTSPPQHCRPCWLRACSLSLASWVSGVNVPDAISSRARRTAASSRLPPPTLPQVWSAPTTIFAPASLGAWPRTLITVTSTPGTPSRRSCSTALSQSTAHTPVSYTHLTDVPPLAEGAPVLADRAASIAQYTASGVDGQPRSTDQPCGCLLY